MLVGFKTKRLAFLKSWETDKLETALELEKYFCDLGMIRCNSQQFHKENSTTVYTYVVPAIIRNKNKK